MSPIHLGETHLNMIMNSFDLKLDNHAIPINHFTSNVLLFHNNLDYPQSIISELEIHSVHTFEIVGTHPFYPHDVFLATQIS